MSPRRGKIVALALFTGLSVWHLALRRHGLGLPLIIDEGEYAYAARVWRQGGLPYRDASSQKPPNVFLLYRVSAALSPRPEAARWLAAGFSLAAMAALGAAAPGSWSLAARLAAPASFAALSTLPVGDYGFPANTEIFLCLFTALSAWALTRLWDSPSGRVRWAAAAGAAAGAALMTKQTSLYTAFAFATLAAWEAPGRFRPRRAGVFVAAAAAVPLGWICYFAARGEAGAFYEAALRGNLGYVGAVGPADLWEQARWFFGYVGPLLLRGAWPATLLALGGTLGARARFADRVPTLATLWLGTAAAGVLTGFFLFPHYFVQAAPALCLAAAWGVERAVRRWGLRAGWAAVGALALWPAAAFARDYASRSGPALAARLLYPNPLYEARAVAEFAAARTRPDETIYVFGSEPQIYVYAQRRCATSHSSVYPLTLLNASAARIDQELARLRAAAPKLVVYSAQPLSSLIATHEGLRFREEVRRWLDLNYRLVGVVTMRPDAASVVALGEEKIGSRRRDWSDESSLFVFERR